jgi:hypothetical protein
MTIPSKRKVPIAQLPAAIEEALKLGPRLVDPLGIELGYSNFTIRRRLEELENEQRVYRVRIKSELGQGVCYLWHYGLAPGAKPIPQILLGQELPRVEERGSVPFQAIVRSWPAFSGRDPLVAALFGPARAEAVWA